jgi:hypothetical protein
MTLRFLINNGPNAVDEDLTSRFLLVTASNLLNSRPLVPLL